MLYRCLGDENCLKTILLVFLCRYDHIESYIDKFKLSWNCIYVGLVWSWNSCGLAMNVQWQCVLLCCCAVCVVFLPHCTKMPVMQCNSTLRHLLILHFTALHFTALHCTALHCTALHCTALHCNEALWIMDSKQLIIMRFELTPWSYVSTDNKPKLLFWTIFARE